MTRFSRPADVAVVIEDDGEDGAVVYLAPLPDGPVRVLNGVGSLIWLEATDPSDGSSELVDRVAALVERPAADIRGDVDAFLEQVVAAGLLDRSD